MHRQSTSVVRGVQRQRNDEARMEWFTKQTSRHHQLATLQPSIQRIGHRARVLMDKMAMPLLTTGYTAKQQASAVIYNGILKIEEMLADLFLYMDQSQVVGLSLTIPALHIGLYLREGASQTEDRR